MVHKLSKLKIIASFVVTVNFQAQNMSELLFPLRSKS